MALDTSIYQNIKPVEIPSYLDSAKNAASLSQLQMQQQQMGLQMRQQMAVRQAYAQNTNPDGSINKQGVLSSLGKMGMGQLVPGQQAEYAKQDKDVADAQTAQVQALHGTLNAALPIMQDFDKNTPEDQKANIYPTILKNLQAVGVPIEKLPAAYDPNAFSSALKTAQGTKEHLDNQMTQANIGAKQAETQKTYADIGQVGDKYLQSFKDDLDPNKARGGNLAKSQGVINAADRLGAMFKQFPDYNIPKAQQTELVSAFGAILNGGSAPLQSQLEEMVPKSLRGDANGVAAWVTNNPLGQDQQKFMKMLHESVGRERDVAVNQVKTAQVQRVSSHQQLFKSNPQGAMAVLHSYGIEPGDIKDGKYVPAGQDDSGGQSLTSNKNNSDLVPSANAAAKPQGMKASDVQALQYLKTADPSDPLSFKIRAKLKAKGIL